RLRPRNRGGAGDVAAALGALLLVAGRRDQLAGELLRAADVNQVGAVVERRQDVVPIGADRLLADTGGEVGRLVGRDLGRGLAPLGDPLLARAVDQLHLVV